MSGTQGDKREFLLLPDDIIRRVLYWLTYGQFQQFKTLNILKYCNQKDYYDENLINLSSTCIALRKLIGPMIFSHLSLVRFNQIDVILKTYQSNEIKQQTNLKLLNQFEKFFRFDYSFHQFVTYLECDNSLVFKLNSIFPNLKVLKLLDQANYINQSSSSLNLKNLQYLSINLCTFLNFTSFDSLHRLDILIDFDQLRINQLLKFPKLYNLKMMNLFLNKLYVINYQILLDWITEITQTNQLFSINFRLLKSRCIGNNFSYNWKIYSSEKYQNVVGHYTGLKFIEIIDDIDNIGIDLSIFQELIFPLNYWQKNNDSHRSSKTLTLIEPYLGVPQLSIATKALLHEFISSSNINHLNFKFGEVIDQADLQALNLITDLIMDFTCKHENNLIQSVQIEKCWSVTDEIIIRDHYTLLLQNQSKHKQKLNNATTFQKLPFNSPRFRVNDIYSVDYSHTKPHLHLIQSNFDDYFWSIESSKLELEQYSMAPRKLSSIWD